LTITSSCIYSIFWLRFVTFSPSRRHCLISDCSSSQGNTWSSVVSDLPVSMYFSNSSPRSLTSRYTDNSPSARIKGSVELFPLSAFQKSFSDVKMVLTIPFRHVFAFHKHYGIDGRELSLFCFLSTPGNCGKANKCTRCAWFHWNCYLRERWSGRPVTVDRTAAQHGAVLARSRVYAQPCGGRLWKTLDTSLAPLQSCLLFLTW